MNHPNQAKFNPRPFLAPRYWLLWLGFGLLYLTAKLPYHVQLGLGAVLGRLIYFVVPRRRRIAETNIRLCFPELNDAEQKTLLKNSFRSSGIFIIEVGAAWWGSDKALRPLCHIEGMQHLDAAKSQGKGVILLSAHFTCLEIGGRLLHLHMPDYYAMYKYHRNPLMHYMMKYNRERGILGAIERSDIRTLIRTLKAGNVCWYALDQDFGTVNAVFAPFFGVQAATLTATSRIAKITDAIVVPFFVRRLDDGSGYQLTFRPALENFPSGDNLADATRTNALIEAEVRKAPDQYLWAHRRFKSRPKREADVYRR